MTSIVFPVRLHDDDDTWMPERAHETDAGFDLKSRAVCEVTDGIIGKETLLTEEYPAYLPYLGRVLVKTGVFLGLRPGWEAQIRPRSGMSLKYGITVVNAPGTIDSDYRNEVGVILQNLNATKLYYAIGYGHKIAQMVIKKVPGVSLEKVSNLDDTVRGQNGFGSTGQ